MVNANAQVTPVVVDTTTGSGTTGASGLGFKARTGSRSSPRTGPRQQNASKLGTTEAVAADGPITSKQNQKEQAEKKNQAINQLRKLLVQGNKRVEALATVIQHLFTEVTKLFLQTEKKYLSHLPILYLGYCFLNCITKHEGEHV